MRNLLNQYLYILHILVRSHLVFYTKGAINQIWMCCASDNTELAGVDDHRVSYFLSLCPQDVFFLECRPLAGEYPAKKIMRS